MKNNFANKVAIVTDDITTLKVDAIVNAANNSLLGGGGVDGAIHHAAGPLLLEECRKIGGCPTGEARITPAYDLPSRFVIHTVGPVWQDGGAGEDKLLASCYANCFMLMAENELHSIAFSAISTGVYGFPKQRAVKIAFRETVKAMSDFDNIAEVVFSCFNSETYQLYLQAFDDC